MNLLGKSFLVGFGWLVLVMSQAQADTVQWLNHYDLLSGNPGELTITTNSTSAGVAGVGSLAGVVVRSSTTGENFADGGNKNVFMGLNLPPQPAGINIRGVKVCYESSKTDAGAAAVFISQIRIAELQNPPSTALVRFDDGTDLTQPGPVCVTSQVTNVAVGKGALTLSLRLNFTNTDAAIVIRSLGIILG